MSTLIQCTHCILDSNDDVNIVFDKNGVCNYCNSYHEKFVKNALSEEQKKKKLNNAINLIKQNSSGKRYDCILGLSGGVDSSFLAMKAKELNLNCLLVHFDNGWNSELAVFNIHKIVEFTGFDLFTYVVDWNEFKDLQLSYIRASVIDLEVPTDHGFYACLYRIAKKHKINSILAGFNHQTEFILPKSWTWRKNDLANILDIHKKFGRRKLKTYPMLSFFKRIYYDKVNKTELFSLLEFMDYNKDVAKKEIIENIGWRDYGGKHYESIFTRFYQGYILPTKFGVDKRKAHLSNLICSGQLTKQEALVEIAKPPCDPNLVKEDLVFFLKKMELTDVEFEKIMKEKQVPHSHFNSYDKVLYPRYFAVVNYLSRIKKSVFRK